MIPIEGFVLAGGQSRRMGQIKALLKIRNESLVHRAFRTVSTVADPVVVVGSEPGNFGFAKCIDDEFIGIGKKGSMVGLYTALVNCKTEWAVILACDMPFIRPEFFSTMVTISRDPDRALNPTIDAILPKQSDGQIQPLCGLYRPEVCKKEIVKMFEEDNWRLQDLAKRVRTHVIEPSEYADLDGAENLFLNVNTPEDYQLAISLGSHWS